MVGALYGSLGTALSFAATPTADCLLIHQILLRSKQDEIMEQEQTQIKGYAGREVSLDEVEAEQVAAQREMSKNSRWRTIETGKVAQLSFTGKVYKREAEYDNGKSMKLDFELTDVTPEGKNKLFSVGSTSKVASAIRKNLKQGHTTMFLSRDGEGKQTKYTVSVPE